MPLPYPRRARDSMHLGFWWLLALVACSPKQRDLSQLVESDASGGRGVVPAGGTSSAGAALGGTSATVQAGTSNTGTSGSVAAGGTVANGGLSVQAGQPGNGGATGVAGGPANQGGGGGVAPANGGASGAVGVGGVVNAGGVINVAGAVNTGGVVGVGGVVGTGGGPACVPTGAEVCDDGVDNDCNGNVDCPIVTRRYPDPSRACAGDDAWVQLTPPPKAIKQVECRSGKPGTVANKLWLVCDTANPTALTVYSMGLAEAKLPASNGVTQFDFRFVFTDGKVSDPRSIVYYAHNSLWDAVKGTPELACLGLRSDAEYFTVARDYIAPPSTTVPTFAAADAQLKPPFIFARFSPKYVGQFELATMQSEMSILSLRHRFTIDAGKQMLLITRAYKSTRVPASCSVGTIEDRDSDYVTLPTPMHRHIHRRSFCDAIVINREGTGVCLGLNSTNVLTVVHANSSQIVTFLRDALNIPWPKADPMMWYKVFGRGATQHFSPKCTTENAVTCLISYPNAPVLPDKGDPYFTTPL